MAYNPDSLVFADRYRFESVGTDWDRGRSGYTYLVSDMKKNERKGVIKRAEVTSKQATVGLKNEAEALRILKELGLGVPKVYDVGRADYDSKIYDYLVIEYIEGTRVEKEIGSLTVSERVEILSQFLGLLAKAHHKGIVNGDVDLKHLFWRKEKQQLIVIDWGNATLHVDKTKKTEFAYDLARTAEIIYSLVVAKTPPATGSIALPDDSKLVPGLAPVPTEFRNIGQWAPRTPMAGAKAPCTTSELFEVAVRWKDAVKRNKPYTPKRKLISNPVFWLLLLIGFVGLSTAILFTIPNSIFPTVTPTPFTTLPSTSPPNAITLTNTASLASPETAAPTLEPSLSPTQTTVPGLGTIPPPKTYSSILAFDFQKPIKPDLDNCWSNTTSGPLGLQQLEGFSHRNDGFWRFGVEKNHDRESVFQTDFGQCPINGQINAISINVWLSEIDQNREFGLFLEDINGIRREYTIWFERVNGDDKMYLSLRNNDAKENYELLTTKDLQTTNIHPRLYYTISLLVFLEINNDGLDILYFKQIPQQTLIGNVVIDPNQLNRADKAISLTLGEIRKFGLIGYGGELEAAIWPLAFLEIK